MQTHDFKAEQHADVDVLLFHSMQSTNVHAIVLRNCFCEDRESLMFVENVMQRDEIKF